MNNICIIYPGTDGIVSIVFPIEDCGLTLQQIIEKDVPPNTPYSVINRSDIPTDPLFRNAWEYSAQ